MIRVQTQDFNQHEEYDKLRVNSDVGAIVCFIGLVREFSDNTNQLFELQHYPGMTEKSLLKIEKEASTRWELTASNIIHRVGKLNASDQIVFVGAASKHRKHAFEACEFMIDVLKTQAPFWKKEGNKWVEAHLEDDLKTQTWLKP